MNHRAKNVAAIALAMAAAGFTHSQLSGWATLWKAGIVGIVALFVSVLFLAILPGRATDESA